jgi:putative ABC transport system permease protein
LHQRGARRRVPNRDASYFETIRLPLLSGRPISDRDDSNAAGVVVINARAAHEYWPGQSPIGQRIVIGDKIGQRPR